MSIGQRVKSLRKERKLSQAELSKKLGIDQSLISYLESGRGTGSSHIASLAHALGVNAHWLETGIGSPELGHTPPVTVEKKYCKEIEEAIKLMEATDDRGRLKMLIAMQDALDAHKAWKNSLPRAQQEGEITETEFVTRLAQKALTGILEIEKESIEKESNDVYNPENTGARTGKHR